MLAPTTGDSPRKMPDPGMYPARCVAVLDLGTHSDDRYPNEDGSPKRKRIVQIQWELPTFLTEYKGEEQPGMATKRYTLSMHEKAALRRDVANWLGKDFDAAEVDRMGGFDVRRLLGRPALLNLTHSQDGKFVNVTSVNPPMTGMAIPPQVNKSRCYEGAKPDAEVYASMSKKTREFLAASEEVHLGFWTLPGEAVPADPAMAALRDEDVPF